MSAPSVWPLPGYWAANSRFERDGHDAGSAQASSAREHCTIEGSLALSLQRPRPRSVYARLTVVSCRSRAPIWRAGNRPVEASKAAICNGRFTSTPAGR